MSKYVLRKIYQFSQETSVQGSLSYKFSGLQACNFAGLKLCNFETLQLCRPATLQACNFAEHLRTIASDLFVIINIKMELYVKTSIPTFVCFI